MKPKLTLITAIAIFGALVTQAAAQAELLPFKFNPPPAPKKDIPNRVFGSGPAGSLDPTFGDGGRLTTDFGSRDYASEIAVQTDGKIVAAGSVVVGYEDEYSTGDQDFAVFRYNADGSLDTSFDGDGKVITQFTDHPSAALAVAIQTDGRIVAAGVTFDAVGGGWLAALARYNTDGSLDTSFGSGGKVISEGGDIGAIVIQPDGKIVADGGGSLVIRYNADGSLDTSFGTGGFVTAYFGETWGGTWAIAVQPDGKIIAAGDAYSCDEKYCYTRDFGLTRLNPDGSLDTSFDSDGRLTTRFNGAWSVASSLVLQPDGKIVATGYDAEKLAVARYNADGSLDSSFDGDGKALPPIGTAYWDQGSSVALTADGKIVVGGSSYNDWPDFDFAVVRLNTDGSLDNSFDGDGKLTTDFDDGQDQAFDIAIQPDGKIVAGGFATMSTEDFALSRYSANGSLDGSFDGDGKVTTTVLVVDSAVNAVVLGRPSYSEMFLVGYSGNGANDDFMITRNNPEVQRRTQIGNSDDRANAAAVGLDRRIVVAGYSHNGTTNDFAVVRYFPDGLVLDPDFGQNGKVTTDFGGNDEATAVAVQADNKIVVVGQTSAGGGAALVVVRYNEDGSLDTSFGTGGSVTLQSIQNPKPIAIQPDGKIIAAGSAPHDGPPPLAENFALARFLPDGSLDTSFDTDGIAVIRFPQASQINALALRPHGKIVAAGFTRNPSDPFLEIDFALARLHSDGSLDTSFDADGKVTTSFDSTQSYATSVGIQRNGKIVAVGYTVNNSTRADFALARYNLNGSLDTTFDSDGRQTTDFFGGDDIAFAAAIEQNGNIIAAGSARRDGHTDFAAARYLPGSFAAPAKFNFDGDGRSDISVFRPSDRNWYLDRSTEGFSATQFGLSSDKITPADYDGDGKTDIAVYRDGFWYWINSSNGTVGVYQFGLATDVPVPADYTGDGRDDLAVFRGGMWWTFDLATNQIRAIPFGISSDRPVPADYDGDGLADPAVFRAGIWHVERSTEGYFGFQFGIANDRPVPADYNGDGIADPAVYRNGTWYQLCSNGCPPFGVYFGVPGDTLVPADYDGDGSADIAVYRNGIWYIIQSSNGTVSYRHFGLGSDVPVASVNSQ